MVTGTEDEMDVLEYATITVEVVEVIGFGDATLVVEVVDGIAVVYGTRGVRLAGVDDADEVITPVLRTVLRTVDEAP